MRLRWRWLALAGFFRILYGKGTTMELPDELVAEINKIAVRVFRKKPRSNAESLAVIHKSQDALYDSVTGGWIDSNRCTGCVTEPCNPCRAIRFLHVCERVVHKRYPYRNKDGRQNQDYKAWNSVAGRTHNIFPVGKFGKAAYIDSREAVDCLLMGMRDRLERHPDVLAICEEQYKLFIEKEFSDGHRGRTVRDRGLVAP